MSTATPPPPGPASASPPSWRRHSGTILRFALGLLFLYAALLKLLAPNLFFAAIQSYELVDANTAFFLSRTLPAVEAAFGLWLLSGWKPFAAACTGVLLLLGFSTLLLSAWLRGLEVTCACFGPLDVGQTPLAGLFRNALLILAFAWLAWRSRNNAATTKNSCP